MLHQLVLDTNIAQYARAEVLEALAARGFRLRVAETALLEWWASCTREYAAGRMPRDRARQRFFGRARSIAGFLDSERPVAVGAGHLVRRIVAAAAGIGGDAESDARERDLTAQWQQIVTEGLTDEEWLEFGTVANEFLEELDEELSSLARTERELATKVPSQLQASNAQWCALPDEEKMAHVRAYLAETWQFSAAAAERLDAHIATVAFRIVAAARGARLPKRNDGADLGLTIHVGDGSVLLTNERRLIDIVDWSGTFQGAWIRSPDDLDQLPSVPPWGACARGEARSFSRRPREQVRR